MASKTARTRVRRPPLWMSDTRRCSNLVVAASHVRSCVEMCSPYRLMVRTQHRFAGGRCLLSRHIGLATCQRGAWREFLRVPTRPHRTVARAVAERRVQPDDSDVTGKCWAQAPGRKMEWTRNPQLYGWFPFRRKVQPASRSRTPPNVAKAAGRRRDQRQQSARRALEPAIVLQVLAKHTVTSPRCERTETLPRPLGRMA